MSGILTAGFWRAAAERAAKTAAQTALMLAGAEGLDVLNADWRTLGSMTAGAALLSVLTSIASDVATGHGPSLTNAETIPDEAVPPTPAPSVPIPGTVLGYDGHGAPIVDDGYDARHDREL